MGTNLGTPKSPADLAGAVFLVLAEAFFGPDGTPIPFELPDKKDTQDDPLDQHISDVLVENLPDEFKVLASGKKLVSPDIVVARPEETGLLIEGGRDLNSSHIIGIEVKKVTPGADGRPSRGSGLDYNSTPPCATVRVYTPKGKPLSIPGFYLYVVLVPASPGNVQLQAMALVTGAAINEDVDLYDRITGTRQKAIGLGTYGDGLDRQRPMLVFANPLGWEWLAESPTLVHASATLEEEQPSLTHVRRLTRNVKAGGSRTFQCYRLRSHPGSKPLDAVSEPFPTPKNRRAETAQRGRFAIDLAAVTSGSN